MNISSVGLKYLLDGLEKDYYDISILDISENNIDSNGIEYLYNFMKAREIYDLIIHDNPIGNIGFKLLANKIEELINDVGDDGYEMNLNNISIDDESVILLSNKMDLVKKCKRICLNGNNIRMNGLKSICEKSLKDYKYPYIELKNIYWNEDELKYYLVYCIKKKRKNDYPEDVIRKYDNRSYDLSSMNLNDSHISLIKQFDHQYLDLSNNKISFNGLKELTDSLPRHSKYISICGNEIGDEGVEIICKYFDKFVEYYSSSLNLSNIGMSGEGLKTLIERLRDYKPLRKIDISGNELNAEELRLMKENKEVFVNIRNPLKELSITIKENINRNELKSFLETFSTIGIIILNGINEEEKKELSQIFSNVY